MICTPVMMAAAIIYGTRTLYHHFQETPCTAQISGNEQVVVDQPQ